MFYIGIDNTQKTVARVVCISDDNILEPRPHCWSSRHPEPFSEFIRRLIPKKQPLLAATTTLEQDPFRIAGWVRNEGGEISSHFNEEYSGQRLPICIPLPRSCRRAFALAMLRLHSTEPAAILAKIHLETLRLASQLQNIDSAIGWQFDRHDLSSIPF